MGATGARAPAPQTLPGRSRSAAVKSRRAGLEMLVRDRHAVASIVHVEQEHRDAVAIAIGWGRQERRAPEKSHAAWRTSPCLHRPQPRYSGTRLPLAPSRAVRTQRAAMWCRTSLQLIEMKCTPPPGRPQTHEHGLVERLGVYRKLVAGLDALFAEERLRAHLRW